MSPHSLWLLRHAKAVADPPEGGTDFDRVLAPRGRRDATALSGLIGRHGKHLGLGQVPLPEIALVSPAARTAVTAELASTGWATSPDVRLIPEFYAAEPEDVLDHLRELPDDITTVMVVGHNPTAHALALGLIAKTDKKGHDVAVRKGFPTCALGIYDFDVPHWSDVGSHTAHLAGLFIPPFDQP
jgi:phosphohistidine phosphatase